MKIRSRVAAIVLIGACASGCAVSGYGKGTVQRQLVAVGVSASAARCVSARMLSTFGDKRLGSRGDPTLAELRAERALLRRCGAGVAKER